MAFYAKFNRNLNRSSISRILIEAVDSQVEIEEDMMLKISFGIDQMFIEEEETEDDEEIIFVDLTPAPEVQSESNEGEEKTKV